MAKRKTSISKIIITVLALLLLVGAIAGFAVMFGNKQDSSDVSTFSVRINDTVTSEDANGFSVRKNKPLSIEVLFPAETSEGNMVYEYNLSFSDSNDFVFYVDYEEHTWSKSNIDVYSCLELNITKNGMTITPKENTVTSLLHLLYPQSEIYVDEDSIDYSKDMFSLLIKSGSGEIIVIGFSLARNVKSVSIDTKEIIF